MLMGLWASKVQPREIRRRSREDQGERPVLGYLARQYPQREWRRSQDRDERLAGCSPPYVGCSKMLSLEWSKAGRVRVGWRRARKMMRLEESLQRIHQDLASSTTWMK